MGNPKAVMNALIIGAVLSFAWDASAQTALHEYRFPDGTQIKVHFRDAAEEGGATSEFASEVLDAAVSAYQTLTQFQGFNAPGYSFASPNWVYAYDPDQTIDIYLGSAQVENNFEELGAKNKLFRDAPCFDTRQVGGAKFEAMILLPADYESFIRNWEKMNPSSLGRRNVRVDLRGTLIHEMTHVILFYYNKNLNKTGGEIAGKHLDWYVEGLARYFETFAGARHDFFSQGFKQTLPDKIRFSRGGSNYFMRYPDQAFTQLRYENALFWRFIDQRFGMSAIESLSRRMREDPTDVRRTLERVTGEEIETLLTQYAADVLLDDFGLKEDSAYLQKVAMTRLAWGEAGLSLVDGFDAVQPLGASCRTDWIGRWEEARAAFGEAPVAGDPSEAADVSAWATDFIEIRFEGLPPESPELRLRHLGQGSPLLVQVFVFTRGGSLVRPTQVSIERSRERSLGIAAALSARSLEPSDVEKIVLAVTNTDPRETAPYEILTLV